MDAIPVNERVTVPKAAVETEAIRSSGPGGQNVNKVSSKIRMRVDLSKVEGLVGDEPARMRAFLASRLDREGRLVVVSQETRDQWRNREICAEKVADLLRASLVRPKRRRPTRPTRASKERRLEAKRRRASRLRNRRVED